MKTILLTMAVWALTATVSYGQFDVMTKHRIAEQVYELKKAHAEALAKYKRGLETGFSLFGADERWTAGYRKEDWLRSDSPIFTYTRTGGT